MTRLLLLLGAGGALGCATSQLAQGDVELGALDPVAVAVMRSGSGEALGTLRFFATTDGRLRATGTISGLTPGAHGIHVHAVGRCEGPSFESAGTHFNPDGRSHGLENGSGPHAGDAPNIEADASGRAAVDLVFAGASLATGSRGYVSDGDGVAVVIHASADDQRSDPAGNSGARVACGVLGAP